MLLWLRRILLGLLGLVVALVVVVAGVIMYDATFGPSSVPLTNIEFDDGNGTTVRGYFVEPDTPGPHPAVLLIHEWWGLNEGMIVLADALAEEGYVVLAADAYRGRLTNIFPRALWMAITTPEEQVQGDIDASLAHLRSQESVDTEKVASMGFCFGGGQSLQLGLRQSENLAVTAMYYGAVVTNPDLLRPFTDGTAVLGIFAGEDQQILPADVLEFEAALNSLNIENQITIYDGLDHGFLNEENFNQPGAEGDAWQQTLAFLGANLKN